MQNIEIKNHDYDVKGLFFFLINSKIDQTKSQNY